MTRSFKEWLRTLSRDYRARRREYAQAVAQEWYVEPRPFREGEVVLFYWTMDPATTLVSKRVAELDAEAFIESLKTDAAFIAAGRKDAEP